MHIQALTPTHLPQIVACLLTAFEGYFVPMPPEVAYWERRFKGAAVDYKLSFGAFEAGQLVGFMMIGVDEFEGKLTAFNTGTGVIPAFRGQQIVDQLYAFAFPVFQAAGIRSAKLEVITENARAIRVYERIGFQIERRLRCLKGQITAPAPPHSLVPISVDHPQLQADPTAYSWDHSQAALRRMGDAYSHQLVRDAHGQLIGYFSVQSSGYIARFHARPGHTTEVLASLGQHYPAARINNVDAQAQERLAALQAVGFVATIDQYEMGMER